MTTERWRYAGRRPRRGGGLLALFVDEQGVELVYRAKHRAIGATYEVDVDRGDGKVSAHIDSAAFVEAADHDDPQVKEWIVRDRAAFAADELRKAEARAVKNDGFGGLTLDELREQVRKLPAHSRQAVVATVTRHLYS